jgi:hypothetical protein
LEYYARFVSMHETALLSFRTAPRYVKINDYRVLELLRREDGMLYGFSVHFSNGSKATFKRSADGVTCENMMPTANGIELNYGDLDALVEEYRVDGHPYAGP